MDSILGEAFAIKLSAPYPLNDSRKEKIDEYDINFELDKHKLKDLQQ